MKLRELQMCDAPFMLEWMHDFCVVENMQTDFSHKTLKDCEKFVEQSKKNSDNLHLAITDDNDIYMGTVSLKNIKNGRAEFAITIRKAAMGKGFSKFGMEEIIRKGFEDMQLQSVYWCVSPKNQRAVKFYDKNGYERIDVEKLRNQNFELDYSEQQIQYYIWYLKNNYINV